MIKDKKIIIETAIEEIQNPTLAVTEQYLNVVDIAYENGVPKVVRVDTETRDGSAVVYLKTKDYSFFITVYVYPNINGGYYVSSVDTEADNKVYFQAKSKKFNQMELMNFTTLSPTKSWNMGEKGGNTKFRRFSSIIIEITLYPEGLEKKIEELIEYLEQDRTGIQLLTQNVADSFICAEISYHNTAYYSGPCLTKSLVKRLSELNLEINFVFYGQGEYLE